VKAWNEAVIFPQRAFLVTENLAGSFAHPNFRQWIFFFVRLPEGPSMQDISCHYLSLKTTHQECNEAVSNDLAATCNGCRVMPNARVHTRRLLPLERYNFHTPIGTVFLIEFECTPIYKHVF
jgi:hypothetical protein